MMAESEQKQRTPLTAQRPLCQPDPEGHCPTCADEAIAVTVLSVDEEAGMACVSLGLGEAMVDITLLGTVRPGDRLLMHGGVALERLDVDKLARSHRGLPE
ncbi:HypC/HybG/HupF family hydrogenase formation chaperone [Thermogemmatispora sp.]|uniref:HypC/HybG/HupF family hydrogenase formation chaperone n=1 Tax=Thermogemmatispora sp. TaxID=1968838 RepID=UPI001D4E486B|nr:HypC/HybG/HupF family hydrogenase formation chaperone [Thermogemmatispora sp.]MBX5448512.1 HypC/HybG/HupF family hydrogenase formation chaperone [Thermogemmatispora sp.]